MKRYERKIAQTIRMPASLKKRLLALSEAQGGRNMNSLVIEALEKVYPPTPIDKNYG